MALEKLGVSIGGAPAVRLTPPKAPRPGAPGLLRLDLAPSRGMLLLQARIRLASGVETDLFASPSLQEIAAKLDGGPDDFAGSASFSLGGAILYPYANRVLGPAGEGRTIRPRILGREVSLPRNWGGKAPGARQYAMHGLILDKPFARISAREDGDTALIRGEYDAGDFGGQWLSSSFLAVEAAIGPGALALTVTARNDGREPLPVGVGWHPYFALPSGRREQARVHIPARARLEVDNYDEVVPTGRILPLAGTRYDLAEPAGKALGDGYFDDCFVDLDKDADGRMVCAIADPASGLGLRIMADAPPVTSVQLYAPPDKAYVALEPQFNWPDPFGAQWAEGRDTGMVLLQPGQSVTYRVRIQIHAL